jgi:hypothetical protein
MNSELRNECKVSSQLIGIYDGKGSIAVRANEPIERTRQGRTKNKQMKRNAMKSTEQAVELAESTKSWESGFGGGGL